MRLHRRRHGRRRRRHGPPRGRRHRLRLGRLGLGPLPRALLGAPMATLLGVLLLLQPRHHQQRRRHLL